MRILYKTTGVFTNFETKADLGFDRNRQDYRSLLMDINNGKNLEMIFKSKSLANSIVKILRNKDYLDESDKLTKTGKNFIDNPKLEENESGIYSFDHINLPIGKENLSVLSAIRRTISNEKRENAPLNVTNLITQNQFLTDRTDEKVYFKEVKLPKLLSTGFKSKETIVEVNVNLIDRTYNVDKGAWLESGEVLQSKVLTYAEDALKDNPYGQFDFEKKVLIIKSLKDFTDQELIDGFLTSYESKGVEVSNFPICIDSLHRAKQYAYLFMYYRLKEDATYSFKEMDEIFQNEVLSSNIFTETIKQNPTILEFQYDFNGFKDNLTTDKFNNLSYKLRVLEEFLELKIVDNEFSKAKNYSDIVKKFKSIISGSSVKHLYMVMGYPFAKNAKTKTKEMVEAFKKEYNQITIVKKGNIQDENPEIENDVRKLDVSIKENALIKSSFHDRYIVFELENQKFEVYLVTCEIGQFFNLSSNEPLGSIFKIHTHEISKDNRNLIQMIKE